MRRYAMRRLSDGVGGFVVKGPQPDITGLVFSLLEDFGGPLGMVVVEHRDRSREWVARDLERGRVIQALMTLRDLLGRGVLDLALFSSTHALEVFLDQWGTLEIRTGVWNEPRIIATLEVAGFERVDHVSPVPAEGRVEHEWSADATHRVRTIRELLGLEPAPHPDTEEENSAES